MERVVLGWLPVGMKFPAEVMYPAMQGMTKVFPEGTYRVDVSITKNSKYLALMGEVIHSEAFDLEWTQNLQRLLEDKLFAFERNYNVT